MSTSKSTTKDPLVKHRAEIDNLRMLLEGYLTDQDDPLTDFDCLRFLQHDKFDVSKTAQNLKYRAKFQRVSPHRDPSYQPTFGTSQSLRFIRPLKGSVSKDGYFLFYQWQGKAPLPWLKTSGHFNMSDFYLGSIWGDDQALSSIHEREEQTGRQSGYFVVVDMEGMDFLGPHGFLSAVRDFVRYHSEFCTNYTGEIARKVVILYPGASAKRTWKVLSMFLPQATKHLVSVISSRSELLAEFEAENLPTVLGGTLEVDLHDPRVALLPDSTYKDPVDPPNLAELLKDHTTFSIPHGRSLHATVIKTTDTPAVIDWSYHSHTSLDLGVFRYSNLIESKVKEIDVLEDEWAYPHLAPMPVMNQYLFPDRNSVVVTNPGVYVFRLHNRPGWFWSADARVHCRVRCTEGEKAEEAAYEIA